MDLTRQDAHDYVLRALGGHSDNFDVDAIVDPCHTVTRSWDFSQMDRNQFWETVARHRRPHRHLKPGGTL